MTSAAELSEHHHALLDVFARLKGMKDFLHVHCVVYLLQGGVPGLNYEFDFSTDMPFSLELSRDVALLQERGYIRDTHTGNSLVLTSKGREAVAGGSSLGILPEVERLEPAGCLSAARVLHLRSQTPDRGTVRVLAARHYWMNPDEIDDSIRLLQELGVGKGES